MTLLVMRLDVGDVARLRRERRGPMRTDFGCTSARLMAETWSPDSLLVLLELPTFELAQSYFTAASFMLERGPGTGVDTEDRCVGYYEDVPALGESGRERLFPPQELRRLTGLPSAP